MNFWTRIPPKKRRIWREWLLAYAFLTPALTLIGVFGLWPVLFAMYVSMHVWRIRRGRFIGMTHYFKAVDVFGLLLFLLLALGLLAAGVLILRKTWRGRGPRVWGWVLSPAWLGAWSLLGLTAYVFSALGPVLDIAKRAVGTRPTIAMFRQWLWEALTQPQVLPWLQGAVVLLVLSAGLAWALARLGRMGLPADGVAWSAVAWYFIFLGLGLLGYTLLEGYRWQQRMDSQWMLQGFAILAGALALLASWRLWKQGVEAETARGLLWRAAAALVFMIAAWVLLMEVPPAIRAGDKKVWRGLLITTYYALGTVPFQLTLGLFFAVLLYQNLPGKELFRVIYFLPYVTPSVASAAVFRLLFSPRPTAPINNFLAKLGIPAQRWLVEPRGVGQLLGEALELEVPAWLHGPSLALVVIMLYSIWLFVGYDIVIYLAGLGNIPTELKEAAAIDGANGWQIFRHVTLPLLSPTIYFLSLIAVIGTFKAFNHIYVMRDPGAQGTVDTLSLVIFDEFFTKTRYGYASALAFVLFAVILSLTYINRKVQESRVFYQ